MNNDNSQPNIDPITPTPEPTPTPTPEPTPESFGLNSSSPDDASTPANPVLDATPAPETPAFTPPTPPSETAVSGDAPATPQLNDAPFAAALNTTPAEPAAFPTAPLLSDQPTGYPEPPKKKKKGLIAAIIIVAALALLGGGAAAAYNLWYQNPEKVVTDALGNMLKAKTIAYTGNFELKNDGTTVKIAIDGKNSDQSTGAVNVTADISTSGRTLNVKGSGLSDKDGNLYVKLSNVEEAFDTLLGSLGATSTTSNPYETLIEKIDDKWIKIAASDLKEFSKEAGDTQKCVTDAIKSIETDTKVKDEITSLYEKNRFIVVGDKLGSKDGSLGYNVSVDADAANAFYTGIGSTEIGKKLVACDDSISFEANDDINDATREEPATLEVWVSRFTHELTEFNGTRTNVDDGDVSFVFKPVFNQAVTVEVPSDTTSLKEIIDEYEKLMTRTYSTPSTRF